MAATSHAAAFASKMHALADAVRSRAFTSASMTIDEMTATILSMDAGDTARNIVEGGPLSLSISASTVRQDAFVRYYALEAIDLPRAAGIGSRAFQECVNLSSVSIGSECEIGPSAFVGCTALESFDGSLVTSVGQQAFQNCAALPSIDLPMCSQVGNAAFQSCTDLSRASLQGVSAVAYQAFYGCVDLKSVDVRNATEIGSQAFYGCVELESVDATATRIAYTSAFQNCQRLQAISLPLMSYVASSAFAGCVRLLEMDLTGRDAVPTMQNLNAFYSTPLYNHSASAGSWGRILVPSSLHSVFMTAAGWSNMASRIVSMSAVLGASVAAFADGVELAHSQGVEIASQAEGGAVLSKAASATCGFNVLVSGLTPFTQYVLELALAMSASFVSVASTRLGYRVGSSMWTAYGTSASWANNLSREEGRQEVSCPFFAVGESAYMAVTLTGMSAGEAEIELSDMAVREAEWEEA